MTSNRNKGAVSIHPGRHRLACDFQDCLEAYNQYQNWQLVADHFGVSLRTIMRRLNEAGYKKEYNNSLH